MPDQGRMVTAALAERIALIRAALGPDPFDELFAAGAGLSQQDAVTAARRRHGEGVRAS